MDSYIFKAFDTKKNQWLKPEEVAKISVRLTSIGQLVWPSHILLMPYSGKTDAKGKALFGGDIVDFDRIQVLDTSEPPSIPPLVTRTRGVVKWVRTPGMFTISIPGDSAFVGTQYQTENIIKVGSIIDNKELLRQKANYIGEYGEK